MIFIVNYKKNECSDLDIFHVSRKFNSFKFAMWLYFKLSHLQNACWLHSFYNKFGIQHNLTSAVEQNLW